MNAWPCITRARVIRYSLIFGSACLAFVILYVVVWLSGIAGSQDRFDWVWVAMIGAIGLAIGSYGLRGLLAPPVGVALRAAVSLGPVVLVERKAAHEEPGFIGVVDDARMVSKAGLAGKATDSSKGGLPRRIDTDQEVLAALVASGRDVPQDPDVNLTGSSAERVADRHRAPAILARLLGPSSASVRECHPVAGRQRSSPTRCMSRSRLRTDSAVE